MSTDKNQTGPVIIERKVSQWEDIMKHFSEAHREHCKSVSLDIPRAPRSIKKFPTGSSYEGTWDVLGLSGFGVYIFPNGVIYEGSFEEGQFHGEGSLQYESGEILRGIWNKGVMVERNLTFVDGLEFTEKDWKYCQIPDRRFTVEYDNDLKPAGESVLTAELPTRDIPVGYYDTGDGFYDPKSKSIYDAENLTNIIRSPSEEEQKWIVDNCRTNPDLPLGPRSDLYEQWTKPSLNEPDLPPPAACSAAYTGLYDDDDTDEYEAEDEEPELFYNWRGSTADTRTNDRLSRTSGMNYRISRKSESTEKLKALRSKTKHASTRSFLELN